MKLGVFQNGWWRGACAQLGIEGVDLPVAEHSSGNAHAADLQARILSGTQTVGLLADDPVDFLLDNGGAGLGFVQPGETLENLKLAHEVVLKPLCSHFIDPLVTVFQGLDWSVVWQCLKSESWVKAVWDRAQCAELKSFGVPNIIHLPMAAPDRVYDTDPLDPKKTLPIVSFVGGQNTSYFDPNVNVSTKSLLAGTLTHAASGDLENLSFYEAYHDLYGINEAVTSGEDLTQGAQRSLEYFRAKLYFNAALCLKNRDRFVIYLKRKLGDVFHLVGSRWDTAYGLATAPRFETTDDYFAHFREAAINLNLVNGNAETGLNMRHFEITAAGGFMMCYKQAELEDHFEIGKECVVFDSEADLVEKIQYYLSHPEQRIEIARAGQRRTLSQHLYRHRLDTLVSMIRAARASSSSNKDACGVAKETETATERSMNRGGVVTKSVPGDANAKLST